MAQPETITFKFSFKSLLIFLLILLLSVSTLFYASKIIKKFKSKQKMLTYKNKEYGISFQYPSSLVLEDEITTGENFLTLSFIGQACSHIPQKERPNFPTLSFSIKQEVKTEKRVGYCQSDSPNCRGGTTIGPFYLVNGLEAEIDKVFGTSTDATGISITHEGLVYRFATTSTATNCGEKFNYVPEIFQMANSLSISP